MTSSGSTEATSTPVAMTQDQIAQLVTTVVAALRQPAAPLSPGQQAVTLKFRLLRNGLGRFQSPSEGYDRALLRMHQIQRERGSALVIDDPIPPDATSMVLVVDAQRRVSELPTFVYDGKCVHQIDEESVVIELVEFLDRFQTPLAAGVPVQIWEQVPDHSIDESISVKAQSTRSRRA